MNIIEHAFGDATWDINSNKPGVTLTILGSIHGNEPCGAQAITWLLQEIQSFPILSGRIKVAIGNPMALTKNTRAINVDMNRLYGGKVVGKVLESHWYELQRIEEIKQIVNGSDVLLDIHSGTTSMPPMTCNNNSRSHLELANILPVSYITSGWEGSTTGVGGDEYMDSQGGIGITLECGQHREESSVQIAKEAISRTLQHIGMWDHLALPTLNVPPTHVHVAKTIYATSNTFTFHLQDLDNFSIIPQGTHIATDGRHSIYADQEYILLMPKPTPLLGQEACYLGINVK